MKPEHKIPFQLMALVMAAWFWLPGQARGASEGAHGQPQALTLDLEAAVDLGLKNNPRIQAMAFALERSRSEIKSLRGRFLPRLSAGYGQTWLESLDARGPSDDDYINQIQENWRLSLQQPLYAGGTILNTYRKAQIQQESVLLEKESEERRLIRRIQEAYLQLLKAREDRRSLEQTVARLQVSHEAAGAFVAQQMAPYVEVLQAQVDLEDAMQQLSQTKNLETIHQVSLDGLLGVEEGSVIYAGALSDIDPSRDFKLDECQQTAQASRTELKLLETNMQLARKEKQIATGQGLPRVTLQMSATDYNRDYDEPGANLFGKFDRDQQNQYWSAGVSVEWNFFNGGEFYYRRQSMENEIQRLERLQQDTRATIRTEVNSAFLRLREARDRVDATTTSLKTAGEGYRMEKTRLEMRVGTIQALLNAQDRLTRAEANRNMAIHDYRLALADLYYAMGTRNDALDP
jgi:outer membrane protein TolC